MQIKLYPFGIVECFLFLKELVSALTKILGATVAIPPLDSLKFSARIHCKICSARQRVRMTLSKRFPGFSPQALRFFHDLERNNNRQWFAEHRADYVQTIAEPMKQLAVELIPLVRELDPLIIPNPERAVSRIYRDTRFSNDKSPYRPNVWIAFRRETECWTQTPVFFFEIKEKEYWFGMGMYSASAAMMRNFRQQIDAHPAAFLQVIEPFRKSKTLRLESEQYKRRMPCEHPKAVVPWYQSKSISVIGIRPPDKMLFSSKIVNFLIGQFVLLKPLYDFLWKAT